MDIVPGSNISVEISRAPTNEAARKTLARVCAKDPEAHKAHRVRKANRPSWQTWRRGGRFWHHQMKSHLPVKLVPGEKYTLFATLDVIRDLQSVERFVKVSNA